jgi:hypothetical protein
MQTVTVKKLNWKDGEGAKGKWSKIGIITEELGDKWLGCFEDKFNSTKLRAIQEGSKIEIVVIPNGDYLNFSFPTKVDLLELRIARLEAMVFPPTVGNTNVPYPVPEDDGPGPDDF